MRWRDGFDSSTSCARFVRRCRWLIFWEASRIVFLFHFYGSLQFRFWCACEHKKLIYCRFHGTFGLAVNGVPLTFRRYDFMRSMPRMCNPLKSFSFCIGNPADSISWLLLTCGVSRQQALNQFIPCCQRLRVCLSKCSILYSQGHDSVCAHLRTAKPNWN